MGRWQTSPTPPGPPHGVGGALHGKNWALGGHGDMYGIADADNRPMILIGG